MFNINYEDISYNYNIINYINQFKEDYISSLSNINTIKNPKIKNTGQFIQDNSNIILDKNTTKKDISKIKKQKIKTDLFNKK